MKYYFNTISRFINPVPMFFLCGVKYNKENPKVDKRVVLKEYLDSKECCSIILEQHFVLGENKKKLNYESIGLKNLNDVETLACMAVDGIFIIHESHSTAAEIALFASNESVADKTFILVPDEENAETNHLSGFLNLAYQDLIPGYIKFYPTTEKYALSENKYIVKTYFKNNEIGEKLSEKIDSLINKTKQNKKLSIVKSGYHKKFEDAISYYFDEDNKLFINVNVQLLKYYIIAIFNIPEFRKEIMKTSSYYNGLTMCENWFEKILLNTIQKNEKIDIRNLEYKIDISNTVNDRLDLRKAISFILYLFHAVGWITIDSTDNGRISISKETKKSTGFKYIYIKYLDIISEDNSLNFEGIKV